MSDITLLPSAKVPLIYPDTNGMTTEWYRFFWNIYGFTGTGVVPVNRGGTGLDTIGGHQIIIGNANNVFEPASLSSSSISITYPAGFVNLELGTSGVTPGTYGSASQVGVFTVNQYGVLTAASNTSIGIDASQIISGTLLVARGGTGQSTYTDGQLLIGNTTGNTLNKATLTVGTGISVTNGAGSITIANTGVLSVSGTAPVVSSGGTTPAISMAAANTTTNGYLTSTDWNTFNGKASAFTYTTGYVPFGQGTTTPTQDSNLFWDNTNKRLGIGTTSPSTTLQTTGAIANTGATSSSAFSGTASVVNASAAAAAAGAHGSSLVFAQSWTSGAPSSVIATGQITGVKIANDGTFGGGLALWTSNGTGTNLLERMRLFSSGGVSIGNTTDPGATNLSVTGTIASGNSVSASGAGGFYSTTFVANAQNPIWRFGNATSYGMSYFQGTSGISSLDTIGFHFGTPTAAGSPFQFLSNGNLNATGTISPQQATTVAAPAYVKGAIYFDTTLNKLRVGGATAWETITSI